MLNAADDRTQTEMRDDLRETVKQQLVVFACNAQMDIVQWIAPARPGDRIRLVDTSIECLSSDKALVGKLREVGRIALSQTGIVTDVLALDDGVTVRISAQRQGEKDAGPAVLFTLVGLPQQHEAASSSANSRRSDADFRLALDGAMDGFMLFNSVRDGSGQIVDFEWSYANSAAARIIGKDPFWFEGRRLLVEMPGNRTDGLFDAYRGVVERGTPWVQNFPYRHEGLDIFVRAVATKVNDGFAVMFADLSEQKRAEARSTAMEERFRLALQAGGGIGAWDWDIVNDRVYADDAFLHFFGIVGYDREVGLSVSAFTDRIHPDDRTQVQAKIAEALTAGGDFVAEYRVTDAEGTERWAMARGQCKMVNGNPVNFPGVLIDVTGRRRMEDALLHSEQRLKAIVNSIDQMIWSTLPDGHHDYFNERWYEFTGVEKGSTDGDGWSELFHPDDQARTWETWRHSLNTGQPYHIEYRLRHRSGVYRWVVGKALPLRSSDGTIIRWYGTCTDVHDLKTAEAQKELIARELSHRIKNLFSVIQSIAQLSSRYHPEAREFVSDFRTRLNALASSNDIILPQQNTEQPGAYRLDELLDRILGPFVGTDDRRCALAGPAILCTGHTLTPLALVFHELATNSMKYGALSVPAGKVSVQWSLGETSILLRWQETGGPEIAGPPAQLGFGSFLLGKAVTAQLDAKLDHLWREEGLQVDVKLPLGDAFRSS